MSSFKYQSINQIIMKTEHHTQTETPKNYRRNTLLGIYVILTTTFVSAYTLIQVMAVV